MSEWVLLIMSCICCALLMGYVYGIGAFFLEMKDSFGTSRAETSLVQSVTIGIMCCGGFISPLAASVVGIGNMCIIGTCVACCAIVGGSFIHNLSVIIITIGVMGGLGLCNMFAILFIAIGKTFKDNYNAALAALLVGGGLGYFMFPFLNVLMMQQYGWRGVFLIHGGLLLNFIPLGMFYRIILQTDPSLVKDKKCSNHSYFQSHISLWKDPVHITFFICLILRSVPLGLLNYFMLDIAAYKKFDAVTGSLFLSCVGLGNIVGRVSILVSRPLIKMEPVKEYSLDVIFTGLTIFCIGLVDTYALMLTCCFLFGIPYGMLSSTANIAVFSVAGSNRYPTALGIYNTGLGIGFGIAGPIGGIIKDNVRSYDHILYGFASICTLSGLCLLLVFIYVNRMKKKVDLTTQSMEIYG
ncbi:monocarboxylate transporter 6 isoform X3 [Patella vulgata]|nr:monocarboxylate transporter 6 isoform X3 [Patella vulgata]